METWGVHSFENDVATEWAVAYREMGLPVAKSTIEIALGDHANNALTADLACRAIAAVEAVAFALGRGSAEGNKAFAGASDADVSMAEALIEDGNSVISAVASGSELNVLWQEAGAGQHESWIAALDELQTRLIGDVTANAPDATDAPVASAGRETSSSELDDLRRAVIELSAEIQGLRQDMAGNFRQLAKRIEAGKQ